MLKRSQSIMDNLDEDVTKKMKDEGDKYWLNIQMEMMTGFYWKSNSTNNYFDTINLILIMSIDDNFTILHFTRKTIL